MSGSRGSWSWRWVPLVLATLAATLGLCWGIDGGPLPEVSRYRDDAYYYFVWAQSLAAGNGGVVSEGIATSGVHLLWGLLLAGLAWCGLNLVVWAQVLGLALHATTSLVLMRWALGGASGVRWLSVAVGLLHLGNPFLLREAQNGQETALGCLLLVVLWCARRARGTRFVLLAALTVLARSDLFFVVVALSLWRVRGHGLRALLAPVLALVPFAIGNVLLSGSPLQDSAAPIPWLMNANFAATQPDLGDWLRRFWWLLRPCLLGWPWMMGGVVLCAVWVAALVPQGRRPGVGAWRRWLPLGAVALLSAAGLSNTAVLWLVAVLLLTEPLVARHAPQLTPELGAARALLIAVALLVATHFVVRAYPRAYYFAPVAIGALLWLRALPDGARTRWLVGLVALEQLLVVVQQRPVGGPMPAAMAWQEEMSMAGRFLDRFVPPDAPVGCFNSGLVTYYRGGNVYNLDGVVDRRAFAALRAGDQRAHWDHMGMQWLVDNPSQFSRDPTLLHASGLWLGAGFDRDRDLAEVARFVAPGSNALRPETEEFRLYRRVGGAGSDRWQPLVTPSFVDLGAAADGGRYVLWRGGPGSELVLEAAGEIGGEPLVSAVAGVTQVVKVAPRGGGGATGGRGRAYALVERTAPGGRSGRAARIVRLASFPL